MRITFGKLGSNLNPVFSRPLVGLTLAAALLGAACGGTTSSTPGTGGSSSPGTAGSSGGGASGGNSGGGTTGSGGSAAGNSAGNTGSAGNGTGGNSVGAGGNSTGGSAGSGTAGSSGGNVGTGGNAQGGTTGGAQGGRGGSNAGTGGAGSGGTGGTGTGGTATGGTGGSASGCSCPTGNTFCSDFETNALPAGAVYKVNAAPGDWTRDFQVDTSQHKCGSSSLRVKQASESGTSGSAYRMLAVPGSTGAFWVRFFMRSDMPLGGDHNAFTKASESDDPNSSVNIEFGEDVGIAFNINDSDRWPTGYGRLTNGSTNPYMLPANTWHCVEISYDNTGRVQQLFVGGMQLINATDYPAMAAPPPPAIKTFKFGFQHFHEPDRTMWYDSVAVAPTRIGGCN
jgi:hypothetical protein